MQETIARAHWHVQLWLVDCECPLALAWDVAPTTLVPITPTDEINFIVTKRLDSSAPIVVLVDHTEIRRLLHIDLSVLRWQPATFSFCGLSFNIGLCVLMLFYANGTLTA
jgi:hypothetical protein